MQQNGPGSPDPGTGPTYAPKGNGSNYSPPQDKNYIDFEEVKD